MQHQINPLNEAFGRCKKAFTYVGVFSFFVNLFILTVPLYMLQLFDRVIGSYSGETLFYLTIIALFALAVMGALDMARSYIMIRLSLWLDRFLGPKALNKSADAMVMGSSYGSEALQDITQMRTFLGGNGIFALFDSPWVPIYIVVIFLLHPLLGMLAFASAVVLFVLAVLNDVLTSKLLSQASKEAIGAQRQIEASVRNAEAILGMGMMPYIVNRWNDMTARVLDLQSVAGYRASIIASTSKFVRMALQILMLGLGAYLVINQSVTAGAMIAGSILLSRALAPVEQAIGVWRQWISAKDAMRRLKKYFDKEDLRSDTIKLPMPKGRIEIDAVSFKAPRGEGYLLKDLTLQLEPGQMLGIIGPTGAGKSTLARLIVGAYRPTAGVIRLDNADVFSWSREDFGQYVGYIPQDVELFPGNIKNNIARMNTCDDVAVIQAARLAGVHDMILKMPKGYETDLTQIKLSGGQMQRIALARALYKLPKLLVLDEPNANLDQEGEVSLIRSLKHCQQLGTTVIVVSHRPQMIAHVDRLAVLNEGKIEMSGPRDNIIALIRKKQAVENSSKEGPRRGKK